MALSATVLSASLRAALLADASIRANGEDPGLTALCDAIAGAVVAHVIANAVVTIPPGVPIAGTGGGPAPVAGATTAPAIGSVT